MVKVRLKRLGCKKNPVYRVVVINSAAKRNGRAIEEVGFYNPKTKEMQLNKPAIQEWIAKGAQPTDTVKYLIENCDENGKLIYKVKEEVKLSKKAKAKLEEEKKAAEEAAAAAQEAAAQ